MNWFQTYLSICNEQIKSLKSKDRLLMEQYSTPVAWSIFSTTIDGCIDQSIYPDSICSIPFIIKNHLIFFVIFYSRSSSISSPEEYSLLQDTKHVGDCQMLHHLYFSVGHPIIDFNFHSSHCSIAENEELRLGDWFVFESNTVWSVFDWFIHSNKSFCYSYQIDLRINSAVWNFFKISFL